MKEIATATLQNNNIIGRVRENNSAAGTANTSVKLFDVSAERQSEICKLLRQRFQRQGAHKAIDLSLFKFTSTVFPQSLGGVLYNIECDKGGIIAK